MPQSQQLQKVVEDIAKSKSEWQLAAHRARSELAEIKEQTEKTITESRSLMIRVDAILRRR